MNITYSTICLSVLILAVSLIIASRNYKLRADKFHECGRRIDKIYNNRVCIWKNTQASVSNYEIEKISEEYLNILDKYENHTHLDYLLFKANNLKEYEIRHQHWFRLRANSLFYLHTIGIYILVISIPLILLTILTVM